METCDLPALIATDLDGTLLRNWSVKPDPAAYPLIEALVERGVTFMAASGRQYASLRRLFSPVADSISYLCENGALVMHRGEAVVVREMERASAIEIAESIHQYPDTQAFISGVKSCYTLEEDEKITKHLREITGNDVTTVASYNDIDDTLLKVAYLVDEEAHDAADLYFEEHFGGVFKVVTSGTIWTDITPQGVDKGTALRAFGEKLGIAAADMMAFGDNFNDLEMLDYVGAPYLMNSGNPAMRGLNERLRYCDSVEEVLRQL